MIRQILTDYADSYTSEDLEATRNYMVRSNARAFETLGNQLSMLGNISLLDLPVDYALEREQIVRDMTIERVQKLVQTYIDPTRMIFLVVGDGETRLPRLRQVGLGDPILLEAGSE